MEVSALLDYVGRGWSIFPVRGKVPLVEWTDYQTKRAPLEQVERWAAEFTGCGWALALGTVSGVVRLDVDGACSLSKLDELVGALDDTPEFRTPPGGIGYLLQYEEDVETAVLWKGTGEHQELRLLSDRAYTIIPPSPHPDGGFYEWVRPPWSVQPARMPVLLRDTLRSRAAARILKQLEKELGAEPPDRDVVLAAMEHLPEEMCEHYDSWVQVGMALKSLGDDLLPVWDAWSSRCTDKYVEGECQRKWATFEMNGALTGRSIVFWARRAGWDPPVKFPFTDTGNAARVVKAHGNDMRFCHPWKKWLVWDGTRWAEDCVGAAVKRAKQVFEDMLNVAMAEFGRASQAAQESDAALVQKQGAARRLAHALSSQERRSVEAALFLAQCELPVLPRELDSDPWKLCCPNGTLDLRTFELGPHCREDSITKLCPTEYVRGSPCARWLQFLDEVFVGSSEMVAWVQRFLGYCLTGVTSEHVLPILWGAGANGKSTLILALFDVLGEDYAAKAPRELLIASRGTNHPTALSTLFGRRLVAAVETGETARLDEVLVKELTSEDTITCRRMREDFWSFKPTHKMLLATNHQPEVRGTDHAVWRRIRMVPFAATFEGDRQDRSLLEKLASESVGILAWMVEGCKLWQQHGLGEAKVVQAATEKYRSDQDRLSAFLEQHYTREAGARVRISELSAKYSGWCRINREPEMSGRALGTAVQERGFGRDETRKYYTGIKEL